MKQRDNSAEGIGQEPARIALLIDAENVNPCYVDQIMDAAQRHGTVVLKRAYADWSIAAKAWKQACLKHSILPIHHFSFSTGKNSTDFYLVIDAMDILYSGEADSFCIASADSDFVGLAMRLRKSGKTVIGIGPGASMPVWKEACTLWEACEAPPAAEPPKEAPKAAKAAKISEGAEQTIRGIIDKNLRSNPAGIPMQKMNTLITAEHPNFTPDQFGWRRLRTVLKHWDYPLEQRGSIWYVMPQAPGPGDPLSPAHIQKILDELLGKAPNHRIPISAVCPSIMQVEPRFRLSLFGKKKTKPLMEEWGYKIVTENKKQYVCR